MFLYTGFLIVILVNVVQYPGPCINAYYKSMTQPNTKVFQSHL
jgi:hypothetical protein